MRLEHCALQVPDPIAMADWYVKNLGCTVARSFGAPNFGHFIAAGPVLIELYKNQNVPNPDYHSMHPSHLHLAFASENVQTDRDRLIAAGAKIFEDYFRNPAGDELVMLRDPWGIGLQLVKRAKPMLA
jgi:glyoxylase I family protein